MAVDVPLLQMQVIAKSFGATRALRDVSIQVQRGQVLALIGENGAGKSTLMKILSGALHADRGTMRLDSQNYQPSGPHEARTAGVAMIYQELNLAPYLSVEDNIMLGQEEHRFGWINQAQQRTRLHRVLDLLGHPELNPKATVSTLSLGAQQLVEIARALVHSAKVIVFDEPTSSLPQRDVDHLFQVIGKLSASGLGIVYISHFLEEIRLVADVFQVLRDGQSAGSGRLGDVTDQDIVSMMVGRSVEELFPRVDHQIGAEILSLHQLSGKKMPRDVSFSLRRGEIFGIAGLVGAGRTETLRCMFGLDTLSSGQLRVGGNIPPANPRSRMQAGLGYLSEDRKNEGLAQELSVADNMTLSRLQPYSTAGWLDLRSRTRAVRQWMNRLAVKAQHPGQPIQALSGGNQQKVAIARILHQDADVLLLDEPTRGIDVATKAEIYRLMGNLAAQGKAIIFVSSYLPELLAICDRLGVMARGRMRDIRPVSEWTEESVLACAIGGDSSEGVLE